MYDRILLPTDGSEGMAGVIEHAVGLARSHDATIHALHILDTATMSRMPMEASWETITEMLREEGERALDDVREAAGDVPVEGEITEGAPSREIVDYAGSYDVDLIVMGTHGRGGLDRLLLGSVAERVIRTAPVPVTTIRVGETPDVEEFEE
ncbi:universal stress protein [Halorhabdus amylolytica]|uniref:universal stress protein n=1 Tax=Halorhabdus amylolytica TaxID=2559573 RepID=UPI0010AA621F|nr:universal stress protein [Halorhabdus amylolytica]